MYRFIATGVFVISAWLLGGWGCMKPPVEITITPSEVKGEVQVSDGFKLEDVGVVAVRTFRIVATVEQEENNGRVDRQNQVDTMGATEAFLHELVGTNITVVDRQHVDDRLEELLDHSNNDLVDMNSAPQIGALYGAQTLIVGRYEFNAWVETKQGDNGTYIVPKRVYSQKIQLKGFDVATGRFLFSVAFQLGEEASQNTLLPASLTRYSARKLLEELKGR